jgi:hypothetical protein
VDRWQQASGACQASGSVGTCGGMNIVAKLDFWRHNSAAEVGLRTAHMQDSRCWVLDVRIAMLADVGIEHVHGNMRKV